MRTCAELWIALEKSPEDALFILYAEEQTEEIDGKVLVSPNGNSTSNSGVSTPQWNQPAIQPESKGTDPMKTIVRSIIVAGGLLALASVSYVAGAPKSSHARTIAMNCCDDPPPCPDPTNPACPPNLPGSGN